MGVDPAIRYCLPYVCYMVLKHVVHKSVVIAMLVFYLHPVLFSICLKKYLGIQDLLTRHRLLEMYETEITHVIDKYCCNYVSISGERSLHLANETR